MMSTPLIVTRSKNGTDEPEPTIKDLMKTIKAQDIKNQLKQNSDQMLKKITENQTKMKEELRTDIAALSDKIGGVDQHLSKTTARVTRVESEVSNLRAELNFLKQERLSQNLCVTGLPDIENAVLGAKFLIICSMLRVEVRSADIMNIFKIKTRNSIKVIVKLVSHDLRNKILENRKKRSIFTDELGIPGGRSQIFLQEDLTKMNQTLLYHARKALKVDGSPFTFAWAKNGRVFLQQLNVRKPFAIPSMERLKKVTTAAGITVEEEADDDQPLDNNDDLNSTVRNLERRL
jgi:hypothetical protein